MQGRPNSSPVCKVFMTMSSDTDIREMLDEVSDKMRYYESELGTKQSCSYEVGPTKKYAFFRPNNLLLQSTLNTVTCIVTIYIFLIGAPLLQEALLQSGNTLQALC